MLKLLFLDEEVIVKEDEISLPLQEAIKTITKAGVEVAIFTHKSYYEIKKAFSHIIHNITFVCDDGGTIIKNGVLFYMGVIDRRTLSEFSNIAKLIKDSELYLTLREKALKINLEDIENLVGIKEEISKISLYCKNAGAAFLDITPNLHKNRLRISYYNENVLEMTEISSTRNAAALLLLRRFGLFKNETAAFLLNETSGSLTTVCKECFTNFNAPIEIKNNSKTVDNLDELLIELSKQYVDKSQN